MKPRNTPYSVKEAANALLGLEEVRDVLEKGSPGWVRLDYAASLMRYLIREVKKGKRKS